MEIRVLERNELKLLRDLCPEGHNWADTYYRRLDMYYSDFVKTFGLFVDGVIVAEVTAIEDKLEKYDYAARRGSVVHLIDCDVVMNKRKQGYGSSILAYVMAVYKRNGYARILISYDDSEVAKNIAKKLGFNDVIRENNGVVTMLKNVEGG